MSVLGAVAVGGAERLVDGHGEASASPPVVALGRGRDGDQGDGVRDPGAGRVRQGHRGDDGLVVAVAAGGGGGRREQGRFREVSSSATAREIIRETWSSGCNSSHSVTCC